MPRLRPCAAAFGVAGAAAAAKALAGSEWATAAGTRMLQMSPASLFSSSLQHSSILRCWYKLPELGITRLSMPAKRGRRNWVVVTRNDYHMESCSGQHAVAGMMSLGMPGRHEG